MISSWPNKIIFSALALILLAGTALGKPVSITLGGLKLNGNLEMAAAKSLGDGVVLITHGTMAHNAMEIIAGIQKALKERGVSSLAITLSLGRSDRKGMYPCAQVHNHKHSNAMPEIGAWRAWLSRQGAGRIALMGHSRGGNQTVWFAAEYTGSDIVAVVALAPMTWSAAKASRRYREIHQRSRQADLAMAKGKGEALLDKRRFLICPSARVAASSFVDYYRDEPRRDTPSLLKKMTRPTLVIAAGEDRVVTDLPARMKGIENNNVRLVVIADAGHMFLDFYLEDAADEISKFLKALL